VLAVLAVGAAYTRYNPIQTNPPVLGAPDAKVHGHVALLSHIHTNSVHRRGCDSACVCVRVLLSACVSVWPSVCTLLSLSLCVFLSSTVSLLMSVGERLGSTSRAASGPFTLAMTIRCGRPMYAWLTSSATPTSTLSVRLGVDRLCVRMCICACRSLTRAACVCMSVHVLTPFARSCTGLLESDTNRLFMGNRDVPLMVAEQLGFWVDYGPRTRDNTWGCALLSRYPISVSRHYLLPSPDGELACAILATLDVGGTPVDVLVAHNGQEETPLDRELQVRQAGSFREFDDAWMS
jgi:hypothetical protein